MAADTSTAGSRADDLRLFAEINGVDCFIANLTLAEDGVGLHAEYENVTALTADETGLTAHTVAQRLWPTVLDVDDHPEFKRAQARGSLVTAKLCEFLLSDEGRSFLQRETSRQAGIAERLLDEAERQADDA